MIYNNMRILPKTHLNIPQNVKLHSSKNPIELFRLMRMYSKERKEKYVYINAIANCINAILTNCRVKVMKDKMNNFIAGYTYRLRKNRMWQKSMYIDALVRNFNHPHSKESMETIYHDIKSTARDKNAEEITLFSLLDDIELRKRYERLGFKKDEKTFINGGYIMRVKTKDFLDNNLK